MNVQQISEPKELIAEEPDDGVCVRAYRPRDESVVLWLHRNGRLHGDAEGDCAGVLRGIADADPASQHHVWVADAREQGCLKLVVHTPLAAPLLAGFFHHMGFAFSRERGVGGEHVLEFYVDLYMRPHPPKEQP